MIESMRGEFAAPKPVDRAVFHAEHEALRIREKAHTHEGDAIAARRRLPMVEADPTTELIGPNGPLTLLDTFEGSRQLIAYCFMWHTGYPAEQCEGCTFYTSQVRELSSFIPATSHTLRSARDPTRRAVATSWAWICPGTRRLARSTLFWLDVESAGCTISDLVLSQVLELKAFGC
jgi:predicted dithiol-disulfide oxidoreductase (DUF899 family)